MLLKKKNFSVLFRHELCEFDDMYNTKLRFHGDTFMVTCNTSVFFFLLTVATTTITIRMQATNIPNTVPAIIHGPLSSLGDSLIW